MEEVEKDVGWLNDPADDLEGDEENHLKGYAEMGIKPEEFPDAEFRAKYAAFLKSYKPE